MASTRKFKGLSRRNLIKVAGAGVLAAGLGGKLMAPDTATASYVASTTARITADEALQI